MKFDSSDLIALLRLFHQAGDEHMPRHIERIEKLKPHDKNVLIRFMFGKKHYAVLIDSAAEDDEPYIHEQVTDTARSRAYQLLPNPDDNGLTTYAMPYRGKECYLLYSEPAQTRLDVALVERFGKESRSTYQKIIDAGRVSVNGVVQASHKFAVHKEDHIEITDAVAVEGSQQTYEVLYEDASVLVINKPVGMLTHAKGELNDEFTAADIIRPYTTYKTDTNRPGIVHRLDRDTSGVLVMVKTEEAARKIQQQFSDRRVKKVYYAVVSGAPRQPEAFIDVPIERNPNAPSTFRAGANGKSAQTTYKVIKQNDTHSLLELRPKTGRTHQLRVHMQYISTPIIGDRVYGVEKAERMYLHAHSLELTLPGGERKVFEAPLPPEFEECVE